MDEELKPCPFCGEDAVYKDVTVYPNGEKSPARVGCIDRCVSLSGYDLTDTIKLWNTRPIEDDLRRQLEEARVALALYANRSNWLWIEAADGDLYPAWAGDGEGPTLAISALASA